MQTSPLSLILEHFHHSFILIIFSRFLRIVSIQDLCKQRVLILALVRPSSTMLNRTGKSGYFHLVPDLVPDLRWEAFSLSQSRVMLAVGFL